MWDFRLTLIPRQLGATRTEFFTGAECKDYEVMSGGILRERERERKIDVFVKAM